jgi:conjugative transfer signal peptidase TraF
MSRWLLAGMMAIAGVGFTYDALAHAGLRFNADQSMPIGAYWFTPGSVSRGEIVQSCLPRDLAQYALRRQYLVTGGSCPDGVIPVVKVLAATSADRIVIADSGVTIDGRTWPMSAIRRVDSSGRRVDLRLPSGRYACPVDQVFLMGEHPRSWDSRYWGCVPLTTVAGRWTPIPFTGWATMILTTLAKENVS